MTAVVVIEAVVIVLLLALVAGLLKSHAEILRRLQRLDGNSEETGTQRVRSTGLGEAPVGEISGVDPNGSTVSVSLRHGKGETLLAFLSTGCASCQVFWDELSGRADMPTPTTRPIIVTKGPRSESPSKVAELAPPGLNLVMSDDAWDSFKVPMTPYFMLVDSEGRIIGEGSASSMTRLLGLFRQSDADSSPVRMNTSGRERFTDERLRQSGVEPGDSSLYEDPLRE
ncbi:MAG: hypothetical protein ACLFWH_05635 [Actinomycetota bacterium]